MNAIRPTGMSDDETRTLNRLLDVLERKDQRNRLRSSYYDGKHAVRQVGSIIPPQYYKLGIVLGWSAKAVDVLARRCNLDGFVWPDGELDDLGATELWDANMLRSEVNQGVVSSLVHATSFIVTTKGGDDEPPALIHFKDARNATGDWNGRRRRMDNLVSVTDRDDEGKPTGLALYLDGVTITAERGAAGWTSTRSEHAWGVPVEAMAYKPQINRPFGFSRISRNVMSLHDQALRTVIRLEAHDDIYAIPDLWMFGADESIFKDANGAQKATWQVVMGRIKGIPDDDDAPESLARADVKQFPASSPEPHLASLNAFAKMFARETSLPDTAVAITDLANPTSAEAYDAGQHELIGEAEGATDDWSPALRRSFITALAIQNNIAAEDIPAEWASIDSKWRNPRFQSRAAQADAGVKQLTVAPDLVGTEVGYELLGLTAQQIERVLGDQRRARGADVLTAIRDTAATPGPSGADDANELKAKFDALGVAIRAGVVPEDAARILGLGDVKFTGAFPASLRLPEAAASALEEL